MTYYVSKIFTIALIWRMSDVYWPIALAQKIFAPRRHPSDPTNSIENHPNDHRDGNIDRYLFSLYLLLFPYLELRAYFSSGRINCFSDALLYPQIARILWGPSSISRQGVLNNTVGSPEQPGQARNYLRVHNVEGRGNRPDRFQQGHANADSHPYVEYVNCFDESDGVFTRGWAQS